MPILRIPVNPHPCETAFHTHLCGTQTGCTLASSHTRCCSERARIRSFILSRSTQSFQTLATASLIAMKITRKIRNAPPRDKRFLPQSNQSISTGLIPFLFYVFQETASTSLHPVAQLARITKATSHHYLVCNYLVRPLERQSRMKGRHRLRVFKATWRICYRCRLYSPSTALNEVQSTNSNTQN